MATIKPWAEPQLPFRWEGVEVSRRNLSGVWISRDFHTHVEQEAEVQLGATLARITRESLKKATRGTGASVEGRGQIHTHITVQKVDGKKVRIQFSLPLKGLTFELQAVLEKLIRAQCIGSLCASKGELRAELCLLHNPVSHTIVLDGERVRPILMTREELVRRSGAA